jgi:hypothetical protein
MRHSIRPTTPSSYRNRSVGIGTWTVIWYGVIWYGVIWYGVIWYGMVWLPGFIGPYPSTSRDKSLVVIQLLRMAMAILYNSAENPVKQRCWSSSRGYSPAVSGSVLKSLPGRTCLR